MTPPTPESWNALLDWLAAFPRENGTDALAATARRLLDTLTASGIRAEAQAWVAHPWRLRWIGAGTLVGMLAYAWLLPRRRWAAWVLAVVLPLWLVLELDFGLPVSGALYASPQQNVVGLIPAREQPARERLVLSAHYDTKTDALDHVARAPFTLLAFPLTLLTIAAPLWSAALRRSRFLGAARIGAIAHGAGLFTSMTAGAFMAERSPGAVDDGAGCAVLIEAARALHAEPLRHTDVEVVFFSGEELGIEGARAWVRARFAEVPTLPTRAINLDGVGAAPALAVFRSEQALLRRFPPDPDLFAQVDHVHRDRLGQPLHRTFYPVLTDARAFLEVGIPALTLASDLPAHALPRGLHSSADERSRVSHAALNATLTVLLGTVHSLDAQTAVPR